MTVIADIKFVYFIEDYRFSYMCGCGCSNDDIKIVSMGLPKCKMSGNPCRFSVDTAILHLKTMDYGDRSSIILEFNDGQMFWRSINYFVKRFYEQSYYYVTNEIVCEKSRRGYLDELPNDIWTMIKKYILSN